MFPVLNNAVYTSTTPSNVSAPATLPFALPRRSPAFVVVAEGESHTLALTPERQLYVCGKNHYGQLGLPARVRVSMPEFSGLGGVVAIAAGGQHSLALRQDRRVYAWGDNGCGQVGIGDAPSICSAPSRVPHLARVTSIAAGSYTSAAIVDCNHLYMWGDNSCGQLGAGIAPRSSRPVHVLSDVAHVACGRYGTVACKYDGTVWAWGSNANGVLGVENDGANLPTPTQVPGLENVVEVAADDEGFYALLEDGTIRVLGQTFPCSRR